MCQCSVLVTILAAAAAVRATWSDESAASEICPKDAQSCSATAYDSCCVPQNGLLVLALQWLPGYCANTKSCNHGAVDRLPSDKWTIHGLWPDTCDGYQVSDCDSNRVYPNTETLLKNSTIEDDMHSFWVSFTGDFNTFWNHEWSKHGTCYSPADLKCLSDGRGSDVVRFFSDVIDLHKRFDLFDFLSSDGIIPSATKIYQKAWIEAAITKKVGPVSLGLICKGPYLSEIRLALRGSSSNIAFPSEELYLPSTCPRYGIKYQPGHIHSNRNFFVEQQVGGPLF